MTDRPGTDASDEEREPTGPTVRDRRRIDPHTYRAREPQQAAPAPGGADRAAEEQPVNDQTADQAVDPTDPTHSTSAAPTADAEPDAPVVDERVADLERQLGERTSDLQRLQAEYVNYKRRVDRDREAGRQSAVASVMTELLGVLDDVASARTHGELEGAFKAVGEAVEKVAARHGVAAYGTAGDPFDPTIHDALMQLPGADDGAPVAAQVLQPGYRMGDRVLRPARVAVGSAAEVPADAAPTAGDAADAGDETTGAPADQGTPNAG